MCLWCFNFRFSADISEPGILRAPMAHIHIFLVEATFPEPSYKQVLVYHLEIIVLSF